MKNNTRENLNKKINQLKSDLQSVAYKGVITLSLVGLLTACGNSDITSKSKAYDKARQELVDAQKNLENEQKDLENAQKRVEKAVQDEANKKADLKNEASKL